MTMIYWLASYPKSGNTWLRLLLQSYLAGGAAVDINAISLGGWRSNERDRFDEAIGIAAADLTGSEILAWRPAALQAWARTLTRPVYLKTHEMRGTLVPADVTLGAVYLVRDPRDVALSLARHMGTGIDAAIEAMGTPDLCMEPSRQRLRPRLLDLWGSWSGNVGSWLSPDPFAAHVLRYETLRADPEASFAGLLPALGLPVDPAAVRKAVAATGLDILRAQEAAAGFSEGPDARGFFGQGRVQGWRDRLSAVQIARIEADHGPAMRRLGYL